jgi:hypothetical protein
MARAATIKATTTEENALPKQENGEDNSEAPAFDRANLVELLSSELILICVASYLPVSSLLSLSSTTKQLRVMMHTTPGVWRTIDLSDLNEIPEPERILRKFLRKSYVARDCRALILDGIEVDHQFLDHLLLREMPHLRSVSVRCCPNLNGEQLIKLIEYIRRPSAPRPLSLRYIAMRGAPLFPFNQPSPYAPVVVVTAGDEIQTDLHSMQCLGKDHIECDKTSRQWHLKDFYPNHPCAGCNTRQEVCMKCHVKKSCVGCHSFYCDECEPHPIVPLYL